MTESSLSFWRLAKLIDDSLKLFKIYLVDDKTRDDGHVDLVTLPVTYIDQGLQRFTLVQGMLIQKSLADKTPKPRQSQPTMVPSCTL